jgi:hypothetical protein
MIKVGWILLIAWMAFASPSAAQSQEARQLLLDVEKLARFKQILTDMEQGYHKLRDRYEQVRQLAQGNFFLHQTFLDSLLLVSPGVKRYYRVAEILSRQQTIIRDYGNTWAKLQHSGQFSAIELHYIGRVYTQLLSGCQRDLGDLVAILTSGQLRMDDGARLAAIDGIYDDITAAYRFLGRFNRQNRVLALRRLGEQQDIHVLKQYYDDIP